MLRNFFIDTLLELVKVKLLIKEKKNTLKRKVHSHPPEFVD